MFFNDINHGYRATILKKKNRAAASILYGCGYVFLLWKGAQNMRTAIVSNLLNLKDILSHVSINSALYICPGYLLDFLSELYIPPWVGKFFKFMLFRLLEMHFLLMPPDKTFLSLRFLSSATRHGQITYFPQGSVFSKVCFPLAER